MKLIDIEERNPNWVLDRRTREVGLKGVAFARAVLENKSKNYAPDFAHNFKHYKLSAKDH